MRLTRRRRLIASQRGIVNRAIRFTGVGTQISNSSTQIAITNDFKLEFMVRLTGFSAQYVVYVNGIWSIIYGYSAGRFELYTENGVLPRTAYPTAVNDSSWHKVSLEYSSGLVTGRMDDVQEFQFASTANVNCNTSLQLGGFGPNTGLTYADIDELKFWKAGSLIHHYSFNEETGSALDQAGASAIALGDGATRIEY